MNKLAVVVGPTASGKTKLAVRLAHKFRGEIISADSRQVYRGMDIGTGKDLADYFFNQKKIPYHLIDVVSPSTDFNVAKYQKKAYQAIDLVLSKKKVPFLVGGTGLYVDAVTKGYIFPQIEKNAAAKIRKKLNQQTLVQLLFNLKQIDPASYGKIDKNNRRRVQRALEIYYQTGLLKSQQPLSQVPGYDILILGIKLPLLAIYQKIDKRLSQRLKEGMVNEIKGLHCQGVSWKKLDDFGLEYRWVSRYLRGLINYDDMVDKLRQEIHHFAKRQLTWFKANPSIIWVKNYSQAEKLVKKFLIQNSSD